jgi:hypothetical protein
LLRVSYVAGDGIMTVFGSTRLFDVLKKTLIMKILGIVN